MSIYRHHMFRKSHDLCPKEELILGLIKEFGEMKGSTITKLCREYGGYTNMETARKAIQGLKEKGFLHGVDAKSRTVAHFYIWHLTPSAKYYLQLVNELYK